MTPYAHTLEGRPPAEWEPLTKHLEEVAETTANHAEVFGAGLWGEVLGRCHDLGKLSDEFQNYLHRAGMNSVDAGAEGDAEASGSGGKVDHSTFGARFVETGLSGAAGQLLAYCIAGHHVGLPDESSTEDQGQRSTLRHRLDAAKHPIAHIQPPEMVIPKLMVPFKASERHVPFQLAFFTRMLFSCLIDADRTRTEGFCSPDRGAERSGHGRRRPSLADLKTELDSHLQKKGHMATPTEVNRQALVQIFEAGMAGAFG